MNPKTSEEWIKIARDIKKFCEDRDIFLGYTDTYYGHLASYVQDKIAERDTSLLAKLEGLKVIRLALTASESFCNKCGYPNDHRQCFCQYNSALEAVRDILVGNK